MWVGNGKRAQKINDFNGGFLDQHIGSDGGNGPKACWYTSNDFTVCVCVKNDDDHGEEASHLIMFWKVEQVFTVTILSREKKERKGKRSDDRNKHEMRQDKLIRPTVMMTRNDS